MHGEHHSVLNGDGAITELSDLKREPTRNNNLLNCYSSGESPQPEDTAHLLSLFMSSGQRDAEERGVTSPGHGEPWLVIHRVTCRLGQEKRFFSFLPSQIKPALRQKPLLGKEFYKPARASGSAFAMRCKVTSILI